MILKSFDNKKIHIHVWDDVTNPVGVVQIVHGMAEHARRYDAFARFLNQNGYIVIADDHRGHGRTDKDTLGYSDGDIFSDTVLDEVLITKIFQKRYPGLKYYVMGLSYGSFITQSYLALYDGFLDGVVLAGSNYKKDLEVYLGSILSSISLRKRPAKLIEKLSFGAYSKKFEDGEWLSNDPENNESYRRDAFSGFTCSNQFYKSFFKGLRSLYTNEYIEGLDKNIPLLIVSGKEDPVGDMGAGVEKLFNFYTDSAGMKNVELVLFESSRHEFLNEKQDRELKWATILDFFNEQ